MYNKKSDYALNRKNKEAIVSRNAAGEYIKLTKEEFASEEEFAHWKEWSDEDYRREYNAEQKLVFRSLFLAARKKLRKFFNAN